MESAVKGNHKVILFYDYNIINLPARLRNSLGMLQLFCAVRDKTMKKVGVGRVVSGYDHQGVVHENELSCFAMQMKLLHKGIYFKAQCEDGVKTCRLKGHLINFMADYEVLARHALPPPDAH